MSQRAILATAALVLGLGCYATERPAGDAAVEAGATDAGVDASPMDAGLVWPDLVWDGGTGRPSRGGGRSPWDGGVFDAGPRPTRGAFEHIAAGHDHSCAISGGHVWCWGGNEAGQLGDGTFEDRAAPVPVPWIEDAVQLGLGRWHTCARLASGEVSCWGGHGGGALGDGVAGMGSSSWVRGRPWPAPVVGVTDAQALFVRDWAACVMSEARGLLCWGEMPDGENRDEPTPYSAFGDVAQVDPGGLACALTADGRVGCRGYGYLGDGEHSFRGETAWPVGLDGATEVTVGGGHICVLRGPDDVRCWGGNSAGALGDGTTETRPFPTRIAIEDVRALRAGTNFTCALHGAGSVSCWGSNRVGSLGDDTLTERLSPTPVPGLSEVVELATGAAHACVLRAGGDVRCWGANSHGQLGTGWSEQETRPTQVGLHDIVEVAAGDEFACALRFDGRALCWGRNEHGEVGGGTVGARPAPTQVLGVSDFVMLDAGKRHVCGLREGGQVLCWGVNERGEIGDGTRIDRASPTPVAGVADAVAISVGTSYSCALRRDGTVVCWGYDGYQEFVVEEDGDPSTVVLPGLAAVDEVVTYRSRTCVRRGGRVECWGAQDYSAAEPPPGTEGPTLVPGLVDAIRLGPNAAQCAVRSGGAVACWGAPLRRGGTVDMPGADSAVEVLGDPRDGCLRTDTDELECWGWNTHGELGDGTTQIRDMPVPVRLSDVRSVARGGTFTCAAQRSGDVYCWGLGQYGELGRRPSWTPLPLVDP